MTLLASLMAADDSLLSSIKLSHSATALPSHTLKWPGPVLQGLAATQALRAHHIGAKRRGKAITRAPSGLGGCECTTLACVVV